jgi:phosphatidylserine/phosphatidylglycerophosphate/cardiolipin synthase-like enzyme
MTTGRRWGVAVCFCAIGLSLGFVRELPTPAATEQGICVYFSSNGGVTDAIVERLDAAKATIDVQSYSFTSTPLAKALAEAHRRGVKVRVILDKSQRTQKYSSATYLFNAGVPTFIDDEHQIAHNKVMLIDGRTVVTGSMNFTKAGEEDNAENLLIIDDKPRIFAAYAANFTEHLRHSERYER